MDKDNKNYNLLFKFIETYEKDGFKGINPSDKLILEIDKLMEKNNQFFTVADLIQMKVIYTSKQSASIIGVESTEVTPYHFFEVTHPDDILRHSLGRTKLFKMAQEFFMAEDGKALLSTNLKIRNATGSYSNLLFQCYLFYSKTPYKTVYLIQVHTNIDNIRNIQDKYHYYIGNDFSYFKYPDEEMMNKGIIFTKREFEIIRFIAHGHSSALIAEKIYISLHTVNTHRRNILKKSGKAQLSEVVYELKEQGII